MPRFKKMAPYLAAAGGAAAMLASMALGKEIADAYISLKGQEPLTISYVFNTLPWWVKTSVIINVLGFVGLGAYTGKKIYESRIQQ